VNYRKLSRLVLLMLRAGYRQQKPELPVEKASLGEDRDVIHTATDASYWNPDTAMSFYRSF